MHLEGESDWHEGELAFNAVLGKDVGLDGIKELLDVPEDPDNESPCPALPSTSSRAEAKKAAYSAPPAPLVALSVGSEWRPSYFLSRGLRALITTLMNDEMTPIVRKPPPFFESMKRSTGLICEGPLASLVTFLAIAERSCQMYSGSELSQVIFAWSQPVLVDPGKESAVAFKFPGLSRSSIWSHPSWVVFLISSPRNSFASV